MPRIRFVPVALLAAFCGPALAADLPATPTTSPDSQPAAPDWKGFYIGSGISFSVAKGAKGQVGGDVFAGYDHVYDSGLVLGVKFDTGYNPWVLPGRFKGFDFAEASVKAGYEIGRFTPYVMTGVALAKPTYFNSGPPNAGNSINGLFSGPGAVQPVGVMGVGVDYAVTNNMHVGVAAYVNNGAGAAH